MRPAAETWNTSPPRVAQSAAGRITHLSLFPASVTQRDGPADDTGSSVTTEPDLIFKTVPIRAQKAITPDVMLQTGLDSSDASNFLKIIPMDVSLVCQSTPHRWEKNPSCTCFTCFPIPKCKMSQRALIPSSLKAKMFILPSSYWSNPPYAILSLGRSVELKVVSFCVKLWVRSIFFNHWAAAR